MSDPRIDPNYRGERCPTCNERLPMLFGNQCNHCNMLELKLARDRIKVLETAIGWVLNDAKYKAPEQVTEECLVWLDRLAIAAADKGNES